jgi:RNA 3'-terminal phosphate cyclase (ATP)
VFQDFAPSPYHLEHVLAVLLQRMGAVVHLKVTRPGYRSRGAGIIELTVTPVPGGLQSLILTEPGVFGEVQGARWPVTWHSAGSAIGYGIRMPGSPDSGARC